MDYKENIGKRVSKTSFVKKRNPKPFKSGFLINTVNGIINHPKLNVPAYTFVEDESYVECLRCKVVENA